MCTHFTLLKKSVLIRSGVILTSFAIVSLTFKMQLEFRKDVQAPPIKSRSQLPWADAGWGGPSGSPVCRDKEDPGWNLDLFAKKAQRRGEQ